MEKWRGILGVLMCVMLIMGMMTSGVVARSIGNPALGPGRGVGCSPKNPHQCHKAPANPYRRGCEKPERCRYSPPPSLTQ
ncbi:hypothetical protein K1719_013562 [Acacia pycnantha]|nr:hypothetical protein K1719_013562 [Acacia pycnantha]